MEVGCLKHPGASTIGSQFLDEDCSHGWQSWQPSHEPPRSKGNRHPSHCKNSGKEGGKGVGGELPGRWAATLWNARERLLYVRHVTLCYDPQARGIPTHAHMCRHRWPPGERKRSLLLTPLNYIITIDHRILNMTTKTGKRLDFLNIKR